MGEVWGLPEEEVRTGSTIIVAVLGLWVLTLISFPLTRIKAAIVAAMAVGFVLTLTLPATVWFFELVLPRPEALTLIAWLLGIGVVLIGIVRVVQQAYVRRQLAEQSVTVPSGAAEPR